MSDATPRDWHKQQMGLQQPSTHIPAAGHHTRPAAAAYIIRRIDEDPVAQKWEKIFERMEILTDEDLDAIVRTEDGFGGMLHGTQDGGKSLMRDQVVSPGVIHMEEHVYRAKGAEHPKAKRCDGAKPTNNSEHGRREAAELEAAIRHSCKLGVRQITDLEWRLALIERAERELAPLNRELRDALSPPHIRCTPFAHRSAVLEHVFMRAQKNPDIYVAVRSLLGTQVAGDLEPTHTWGCAEPTREAGLDFDDLPHAQWNEFVDKDVVRRAAMFPAEADAVFAKTMKEVDKGLCDGPWEKEDIDAMYGVDTNRTVRRFGVDQKGDIRCIDNDKENLLNATSIGRDKLSMTKADFPARMSDRFAHHKGRQTRGWSVGHGTEDVDAAYRRVLTMSPGYNVVAIFHPVLKRTVYFTLPGQVFGAVSAVTYFCAVPAFLLSVARRVLGIVASNFVDDVDVVALDVVGGVPQRALRRFFKIMGMPFSDAKHIPWGLTRVFCGVVTDFSLMRLRGVVKIYVDKARRDGIIELISSALETQELYPKAAATLAGKLQFSLSWAFGRVGKAAMQPINKRAEMEDTRHGKVSPGIVRSLNFLRDVVSELPPRILSIERPWRPPVLVWTDAMYEAKAAVPARGGFIVIVPEEGDVPEHGFFSKHDTPRAVISKFVPGKKQYIGQLELLYSTAPYHSLPHVFAGRDVLHFIDNTSAVAALVKGYSRAIDSGLIVNAFHAFNAGLRADVWFEYVNTHANWADLPSREGLDELWEIFRRMGIEQHMKEVPCVLPKFESWEEPAAIWMAQGAQTSERAKSRARHAACGKRRRADKDERRSNAAVRGASKHATSHNLGDEADAVAQAHFSVAQAARSGERVLRPVPLTVRAAFRGGESIGMGVFATRAVAQGTCVGGFDGALMPRSAWADHCAARGLDQTWAGFETSRTVESGGKRERAMVFDPSWRGETTRPRWSLFNHARGNANCAAVPVGTSRVELRTTRDVQAGEELTYFYSARNADLEGDEAAPPQGSGGRLGTLRPRPDGKERSSAPRDEAPAPAGRRQRVWRAPRLKAVYVFSKVGRAPSAAPPPSAPPSPTRPASPMEVEASEVIIPRPGWLPPRIENPRLDDRLRLDRAAMSSPPSSDASVADDKSYIERTAPMCGQSLRWWAPGRWLNRRWADLRRWFKSSELETPLLPATPPSPEYGPPPGFVLAAQVYQAAPPGPPPAPPPPSPPPSPPSSPTPARPKTLDEDPPKLAALPPMCASSSTGATQEPARVADVRLPTPSAVRRSLKSARVEARAIEHMWRKRVLETIDASAAAGHALGAGSLRVLDEEAAKPELDPWLRHLLGHLCDLHDVRLYNGDPTELTDDDWWFYRDLLQRPTRDPA